MATIDLDTSRFPLVISRFPPRWGPDELDDYFERFHLLHAREEPFVFIAEVSATESMSSAATRRKATEFMDKERERSARLCKGAAQVARGRLTRGAITAIHWVSPPPYPHKVFASYEEAFAWVKACALEAGLVIPAEEPPGSQ